jgi:hypothetical protein
MFFNNKEEPSDQFAVYKKREVPRYKLKAGVSIEGFEGEGKMVNISVLGCCIESVTYADLKHNEVYRAKIIPDQGENAGAFNLKLKLNWAKSSETLYNAGFYLADGYSSPELKKFVDQLQSRGAQSDYGQN